MNFGNSSEDRMNAFTEEIRSITQNVKKGTDSILIKHPNIIEELTTIKAMAEVKGLIISEIKLRENTLEDVFIHLTGRNLRQ
jgi:hypothetical protein